MTAVGRIVRLLAALRRQAEADPERGGGCRCVAARGAAAAPRQNLTRMPMTP